MKRIHSMIRIKFCFTVRNKNKFNGIKDSIVYYNLGNSEDEGRICLFNSSTCSVEEIVKFHNYYKPNEVTTTQNKVSSYIRYLKFFIF